MATSGRLTFGYRISGHDDARRLLNTGVQHIMGTMTVRRMVPNLLCKRIRDTRAFYEDLLKFGVAMDMGWIVTLASPENETAQLSLSEGFEKPQGDHPVLTVEVAGVDEVYQRALAHQHEITMTLRDEEWGVRRFFVRDPDGRVVNIMGHPPVE